MDSSDSALSVPSSVPLSEHKENYVTPATPKIAELNASRQELLSKLQNLKQDLQNWRFKLDSQVKTYSQELSELKESLNTEVEQLRTEFQELRTTLKQQQEDVTASLKNLGLQDESKIENNDQKVHEEKPKVESNGGDEAHEEPTY